jgi:hypothetical protein
MDDHPLTTAGEGALYLAFVPWIANACSLTGAG